MNSEPNEMSEPEPNDNAEQQIDELFDRYSDLRDRCHIRSADRISREIKRIARTERLVIPYLYANHQLMNNAQSLLDPDFGAEISIESIAILESEERARQIQADLPEGHYEYVIHSMSSCAYDNLAKHIAQREGYNSNGVHDCIADGIQVCRRTGKLECISCFREYATDVYVASDDLEMAHHHAMAVMQNGVKEDDEDSDRRWVGAKDLVSISLLQGQLDAALDHCDRVFELAQTYHSPFEAKLDSVDVLKKTLLLAGREDEYEAFLNRWDVPIDIGQNIPKNEYPAGEIGDAKRNAIAMCCSGNYSEAIDLLTEFDRLTKTLKCRHEWFGLRVQLIAAYLLKGDRSRSVRLAEQLVKEAGPARDWLTIRQVKALTQGESTISPLGQPTSFKVGPFADRTQVVGANVPRADGDSEIASSNVDSNSDSTSDAERESSTDAAQADEAKSALTLVLQKAFEDFVENREDSEKSKAIVADLLKLTVEDFAEVADANRALHLVNMLSESTEQSFDAWRWCQPFFEHFANDAVFVNVYANMAHSAREEEQMADRDPDRVLTFDKVEDLFQRSLDLDPERANNFARAGQFYLSAERVGDAERCFARGFRLARDDDRIALQLAEIYTETDRVSDALNVLDMCIREGCEEPGVFWQAAMTAVSLDRHQIVVSYLEKFDQMAPGEPWTQYYLAMAYVELSRPDDALKALKIEEDNSSDTLFGIEVLRAAAIRQKGDTAELKQQLDKVLAIPLAKVDYLTRTGITSLFNRLYDIVSDLPKNDQHQQAVWFRGVQTGLAPDEFFEASRLTGEPIENVGFYVCTFEQLLNKSWPNDPGCLYGQDHWTSYVCRWGVLAQSEEEAISLAQFWQDQCYKQEATLLGVDFDGDGYEEPVGVVWQSAHFHPDELNEEDAEFDDDDFGDGSFDDDFDQDESPDVDDPE
jgi:tetratricopeptide (TPR) repeat protein